MTREEAITVLKGLSDNPLFSDQHRAAFKIAIHDIKGHHEWALNNLILINKDNYEPLDQEPRKDEVILTNKEYRELISNEYDHGYCKGYEEALEGQEPIDYKAQYEGFSKKAEIVISQLRADRDRLLETFDKIRAEIKALSNANPSYWHSGDMVDRDDVLEIIDKYKAEQEET